MHLLIMSDLLSPEEGALWRSNVIDLRDVGVRQSTALVCHPAVVCHTTTGVHVDS